MSNVDVNVLLADDDPVFRELAASYLKRSSCLVLQVPDGGTAWQTIRSERIDIAVVDYEMPGIDGLGLIQCLRGHPLTRHIPIVMCTSKDGQQAWEDAMAAGATTFFEKPVNWPVFEKYTSHLIELITVRGIPRAV